MFIFVLPNNPYMSNIFKSNKVIFVYWWNSPRNPVIILLYQVWWELKEIERMANIVKLFLEAWESYNNYHLYACVISSWYIS